MSYAPDSAVRWIVVHYSATAIDGRPITAADIDEMHRKRGFREIGYHYFIRRDGTVETGRDLTRPGLFETGAHSQGENGASVGVCYEGGVTSADVSKGFDTRTTAQTGAMIRVIRDLLQRFPNAEVRGHRDMPGAATQCPGFDAGAWWATVSKDLSRSPATPAPQPDDPRPTAEARLRWRLAEIRDLAIAALNGS